MERGVAAPLPAPGGVPSQEAPAGAEDKRRAWQEVAVKDSHSPELMMQRV